MRARPSWLVAAAVAAVVIVVEAPVLLGGRTWADRGYQTEVVPVRAAAADALALGRLPEWWDGSGLGVPLAAEPSHGALYPGLALVAAAPDDPPAIDLLVILHVLLAAIGVAMWARRRGADDLACTIAGAGLAASGALHAALLAGGLGVAWLPWAAWAAEGLAAPELGAPPGAAPLALGERRTRYRRATALAAIVGVAGLAGSPAAAIDAALLALVIVATASTGRDARAALGPALAAIAVAAAASAAAWLPALVHRAGDVAASGATAPGGAAWLGWLAPAGDAHLHLGAVWLALAAIGALAAPRRRAAILAAVALAALALAPALTAADPAVHVAAASIVACGLGAVGLERLAAARGARLVVALGGAAVVVGAALAARHGGAAASVAELVAIAALAVAWPRAGGEGAAALACAVLVVGPALLVERDAAPLVARDALAARPVLAPAAGGRVYRPHPMDPDDPDPAQRAKDDHATVAGDVLARFGGASAQSPDPGRRAVEDDVWHAAGLAGGRLFDRYAVDAAILPATVVEAMQQAPLAQRGRWVLIDARPSRPRAFVARRSRGAASRADEVARTFPGADMRATPLDTVVLAGGDDVGDHATAIARCERRADAPERVIVSCPGAPAGWAVVDDAWAPGWTATVDGADAPVLRAEALVRAVHVDAGDHQITWTYRAPWLRAGLFVSGLAWVHLALLAWLFRRARPRPAA